MGLDVRDLSTPKGIARIDPVRTEELPIVVPVQTSRSDFDAFPAAPENFVGRKSYLSRLQMIIEHGHGVFVLNAQSGWGKSSNLALQAKQFVQSLGGFASVLDSRTASSSRYVTEVLRQSALAAEAQGIIKLRNNQSWTSLSSALASIEEAERLREVPIMIFFDQFENVFFEEGTTREFRDLALRVRDTRTNA